MKIFVVCAGGRLFGKEMVTLSLMDGLTRRGHEVACLMSNWNDGRFEDRLKGLAIPHVFAPLGFISKTLSWSAFQMTFVQILKLPQLWLRYLKAVKSFKPDVIFHSGFHHLCLLWPLLGDEINIFHVHDAFPPTSFHRRLFKILNRRVRVFLGVSHFISKNLLGLGLPEAKVCFVLNGISTGDLAISADDENALNHRQDSNRQPGPIRIGIVGQIDEWKGHEDLIEALRILQQRRQQFICRIFGAGSAEFEVKLKAKIHEYGLTDRIEWMGFVHERRSIYETIDVCVVPSRIAEAFGLVAAEASMYGIPVVATRLGALTEVVLDRETGYIVDPKCPEGIAEKIRVLSASPSLRAEMGRKGRTYARTSVSADKMVDLVEALLQSQPKRRQ